MVRRLSTTVSRSRLAGAIVLVAIVFNVSLDYHLFLRNPRELEAQAKRFLRAALPGYRAQFGAKTSFNFLTGKLELTDVRFHHRDHPGLVLFEVPRLTVVSDGLIPSRLSIRLHQPVANLVLDPDGLRGFDFGADEEEEPPDSLPLDLEVEIVDGRVRLQIDQVEGINADLLITNIGTLEDRPLLVHKDLSAQGALSLYIGSLVDRAEGATPPTGLVGVPADKTVREVIPNLEIELSRAVGRPVGVNVNGRVKITQVLRGLIPLKFQEDVWDQLGVLRGEAEIEARVRASPEGGATVDVSIHPHDAAIKPKGFPVEIVEIGSGRFEISVAIPPEGAPEFLGVGWEGIRAKIAARTPGDPGLGDLVSRGGVYPGRDAENVTIQLLVHVKELPLADQIVEAFPPQIREVYGMFDPQGTIPEAHVQIFKGPEERDMIVLQDGSEVPGVLDPKVNLERDANDNEVPSPQQPFQVGLDAAVRFVDFRGKLRELPVRSVRRILRNDAPQISVWIPRLEGRVSACFEEVPARMNRIQGWFRLSENANVELFAEGDLELGGRASVEAMIMHGDLFSIGVKVRDVPMGPKVIAAMPGSSRDMIAPFRLNGGEIDADVTVHKAHARAPVIPVIKTRLRGVSFDHRDASIPLTASGALEVRPRFETAEQSEPSKIDLKFDFSLAGEGVTAAVASGTLSLPPRQPPVGIQFTSNIGAAIERLEVGVLPALIRDLLDTIRPQGAARDVRLRMFAPDKLRVSGEGEAGLQVRPRAFDVPLRVKSFDAEVKGKRVSLHAFDAARTTGGSVIGEGWFSTEDASEPNLSLDLQLRDLPVDAALISAFPAGPREALAPFEATGTIGGKLTLDLRPGLPADYTGSLQLRDMQLSLHRLHERLIQFESAPLRQVTGRVDLSPAAVHLRDVRGRVAGAELRMERGELRLDPAKGELTGFDLPAELVGLQVNERTRALAGPAARETFDEFRTDGPADVALRLFQADPKDETHLHLRARLQGAKVVASLFPVPITDLRGEVVIEDGEPVRLDLAGRLSPPPAKGGFGAADPAAAKVRIWRDATQEQRFPQGGRAGRVYRVAVEGFKRYPRPEPRAEGESAAQYRARQQASLRSRFEAELPTEWLKTLDHFDPAGRFDVEAWTYQPTDTDQPLRWAAEVQVHEGAMTLVSPEPGEEIEPGARGGLGFENLDGVIRLRGRLSEMEQGSCEGELNLQSADFFKQTFSGLRGPLTVRDGKLSFGHAGQPFTATLYDGDFVGRADYDFRSGAYRCGIALGLGRGVRPGRLRATMRELGELSSEPEEGPKFPYRGRLTARVSFGGGGPDLMGQPHPFRGNGRLQLTDSNLLDTPFLKALQTLVAKLRGSRESDPLPNMDMRFRMNERGLRLQTVDLWGKDLKVHGEDGELRYDGFTNIVVVTFDTSGGLHELLKWVPGTGYRYRGFVQEGPTLRPYLNPLSTIDWFRDLVKGDD